MATATLETPTDATAHSPDDELFDAEHRSISSGSSSSETSNMSGRPAMRNSTTQTLQDGAADEAPRKLKAKRPSFKLFNRDQKEKADDKDKTDDRFKKRKGITSMLRKEKSEGHKRGSSMTGDELGKKEKRKSFLEILGLSDYEGDEPSPTKPRSGNNLNVLGFSDDERPPTASSKRRNRLSLNLSDLLSLSDADSADEGRGVDQPDKRRKRLSMSISDLFQRRRGGSDGRISPLPQHQDAFFPQRAATPGPYDDVQQQRPELPRSLSEQPFHRGRSATNSTSQSSPGADGEDVSAPVTPSTSVDEPLNDEIEDHQQQQQQQEAHHEEHHPKRHQQGPLPPAITTRPTRPVRVFNDESLVPSPVAIHITPPPSPDEPRKQSSLRYSVGTATATDERRSALRSNHQQQDALRGPSITPSIESVMLRQLEVSERMEESLRRLETRVDEQREEIGGVLTSRYEETIRRLEEKVDTQSKELEVLREGLREVVSDLYPGQSRLLEAGHTHSFGNQSRQIPDQQQQQLVSTSSNYTLVNSLVVKPIRETVSTSYEMGKNVLHTLYVRPVVIIWNTLMPTNNEK